ncbi:hypothetical protein ACQUSR_03050 [Streptomyces sp. P1-3]
MRPSACRSGAADPAALAVVGRLARGLALRALDGIADWSPPTRTPAGTS